MKRWFIAALGMAAFVTASGTASAQKPVTATAMEPFHEFDPKQTQTQEPEPAVTREQSELATREQELETVLPLRVPDEDDILFLTMSADSPYFYPRMMVRYMAGDLTLTADHYYYLYYGYAYDDSYDAHKPLPGENAMLEIFSRTNTPSTEDAMTLIEAGKANMLVDPFSPSNINMMTWAYQIVGDSINTAVSAARYRGIVQAIESSGTGVKERSPRHILRFSHADDLAAARGLKIVNRQVRSEDVEYLQFDKNRQRLKGWFFDFGRVYWNPYEGDRLRRKSRWEFNGIPL
jgi:hypothetical protein